MALVKKRSTLKVWGDVIFAIFLRELKSKFNDKLGLFWSVISPVAFIFMLSFMRGRIDGGETHGIPTFFFMMYGMLLIQLFLGFVPSISSSFKKNKELFSFRQVQPISSIIATFLFLFLNKVFVISFLLFICYLMKFDIKAHDPLMMIIIFMQVCLISSSLGVLFAITITFIPEITKIQNFLLRPMFFISGIFFSLQDIPREYWSYLDWNPFLHAIELMRYAAYSNYGNEGVSQFYLDMFTIGSLFFALACYHISWKQAISR